MGVQAPVTAPTSGQGRCPWARHEIEIVYHDTEWGVPLFDERALFEFLLLEGAQAGLSWHTILAKRDRYRQVYDGFDPVTIAAYGPDDDARLLSDAGIVRNRLKVGAFVRNARAWLELDDPVGFLWSFVGGAPITHHYEWGELPASTDVSDAMSKALKRAGFTFVGSTICYAFMQATGMVNDHVVGCFRHAEVQR
jgi:DNA-3-methyladenine glycosylase I